MRNICLANESRGFWVLDQRQCFDRRATLTLRFESNAEKHIGRFEVLIHIHRGSLQERTEDGV
jgi:hypothetical protein